MSARRPSLRGCRAQPAKGTDVSVIVVSDDQSARPLRRVSVSLQLGLLSAPRTVVTDDDGRAVFTAVAPGNYLLIAFKPGYVRTYYGSKTPGRGPGVAVAVLEGKPVPELRLKVPRGAVIGGTVRSVTGRPAANQMVQVLSPNAMKNLSLEALNESTTTVATTDDRGMYRVYGLAPGSYIVSVTSIRNARRVQAGDDRAGAVGIGAFRIRYAAGCVRAAATAACCARIVLHRVLSGHGRCRRRTAGCGGSRAGTAWRGLRHHARADGTDPRTPG